MRLLISGYYGFHNAGDEAVLAAILDGVRRRLPAAEVCVLSADPPATSRLHCVPAVQRWSLPEVWRALGRADLLVQGGGGLIQDATSRISPLYYLGILRMARLRRVPAMIFAQGLGPLHSPWLRRLTRREFSRAAAITVRDEGSLRDLAAMGLQHPAPRLATDPALLLEPAAVDPGEQVAALGLDPAAPRALIVVRQWPGAEGAISACRDLAADLAGRGMAVLVAPFQAPQDIPASEQVTAGHPSLRMLPPPADPREFVSHVAAATVVVSMRLHGIIFAAAHAVPAVGIAYDPKLTVFAARAGQPVLSLDECTAGGLQSAVEHQLAQADTGAATRSTKAQELRAAAELSFEMLQQTVGGLS